MTPDPNAPDELTPPEARADDDLPLGEPLEPGEGEHIPAVLPVPVAWPRRPQPHFGWALLWTLGFAVVLFGTMIGIVVVAAVVVAVRDGTAALSAEGGTIPPALADVMAVSVPVAYLAGLGFTLLALRVVAGRDWRRQVGLRRPPLLHVFLAVIALPAFVMASNGLAQLLMELFGSAGDANQDEALRELLQPFPWWFAVLAIGVCPGVVEELWCRGFLGRGLVGRYGWPVGILLTSLFFGLLHVFPPWYVVVTATMGVGLHLVYLASRSLWVPILLHTLNNSLATLMSVGVIPTERLDQNTAQAPVLFYLLGAGLLVSVGVAIYTGRVRLVPADPSAPLWEPPFPGVAHPPPGANAVLRTGQVSRAAVALAVTSFVAFVYLLAR
jgi:membrane protease YdiL (CAAX protease family)